MLYNPPRIFNVDVIYIRPWSELSEHENTDGYMYMSSGIVIFEIEAAVCLPVDNPVYSDIGIRGIRSVPPCPNAQRSSQNSNKKRDRERARDEEPSRNSQASR